MDCKQAQQTISAAYDSESQDARELELAKEHCRSCAECAGFVSTLAAINRLEVPEIPVPALERTLAAVRQEYPSTVAAQPDTQEYRTAAGRRAPGWAPWAAAAAVLMIVAGVITAQGVRYLIQSPTDDVAIVETYEDRMATAPPEDPISEVAPPLPDDLAAAPTGPAYVVFEQAVYRLVAPVETPPRSAQIGSVTSSLDTGGPATTYPVYADPSSDAVLIEVDEDTYLRMEPVVRTLRGTRYALRSGPITLFGQWPSLPTGIPEPSAPDGSPVFIPAGTDDAGVTVYVRPGTDPAAGFAIAPGTPATDPAAGNTGWTWWEPLR